MAQSNPVWIQGISKILLFFPDTDVVQDYPRFGALAVVRVCGRYKIFPLCPDIGAGKAWMDICEMKLTNRIKMNIKEREVLEWRKR
jgi:hypothetical protein